MKRKDYQKPTMNIVKLQHTQMIMTSAPVSQTKGASIDDYEDGEFSWDEH